MTTGAIYKPFSQFSEIQITLEQFRKQLFLIDSAAQVAVVGAYEKVNRNLDGRIRELVSVMQKRKMTGASIKQLLRYRLVTRFRNNFWIPELYSYLSILARHIEMGQTQAVALAQRAAFEAVAAGLPKGVTPEMLARMGIEWNRVPPQAMANIVASTEASAPVGRIIGRLGQEVAEEVMFNLVQGIALGKGPRETARRVTESAGMGLSKALTLTRTETMRAYREASRMQYGANPNIVKGYRRMSAKDGRVCMACLVLDGELYELNEPLQAHPNCRCTLVPETLTYQDLGIQDVPMPEPGDNGREWFRKQPRNTQLQIMGNSETRLGAWERGDVTFGDMYQITDHPVWGKSASVKPLRDMGLNPADYARHKNTKWVCLSPCEEITLSPLQKRKLDQLENRPFLNDEDIELYREFLDDIDPASVTPFAEDMAPSPPGRRLPTLDRVGQRRRARRFPTKERPILPETGLERKLDDFGPAELASDMPIAYRETQQSFIDEAVDNLEISHNTYSDNLVQMLEDDVMMPPGLEQWRERYMEGPGHKFVPGAREMDDVTKLHLERTVGPEFARAIEDSHMIYGRGVSASFQPKGTWGNRTFGDVRVRFKDDVLERSIFYENDVGMHFNMLEGVPRRADLPAAQLADYRQEFKDHIAPIRIHGDHAREVMRRRYAVQAEARWEYAKGRGQRARAGKPDVGSGGLWEVDDLTGAVYDPEVGLLTSEEFYRNPITGEDIAEVFGQQEIRVLGGVDINDIDAIILESDMVDFGEYDDLIDMADAKGVNVEIQRSKEWGALVGEERRWGQITEDFTEAKKLQDMFDQIEATPEMIEQLEKMAREMAAEQGPMGNKTAEEIAAEVLMQEMEKPRPVAGLIG